MFFGAVLKPGTSFTPEVIDGEILHISQACLYNPANVERTYLEVVDDDETYAACVLQKEKQESVSLDLYLNGSNGSKLQISGGRNEVHIVGYYEPQDGSDSEDISVSEPDGYDFDNDDSSSENVNSNRCKPISSSKADKGADDEDDEDDDDEDDDDEEDDEEDDDENDDDDDENAESDAASDEQMSGKQNGKFIKELKQNSKTKEARPESNKRHSNSTVSKPSKMAKRERGKMSPEAEFEKQIVDYLKSSGRVMISQLAGKIRKPDSLKTMRYQAFLKSKPSFKVDGQYVSLKS